MNRQIAIICYTAIFLLLLGCQNNAPMQGKNNGTTDIKHDFSTPEGALLCLEDAYRAKDVNAAVACKDFHTEARLMLEKLSNLPQDQKDEELVKKTAEVLELSYRKEKEQKGFPSMEGVVSTFPKKELLKDNIYIITEVCQYPDGGTSQQRILVANTARGWRVLNPLE